MNCGLQASLTSEPNPADNIPPLALFLRRRLRRRRRFRYLRGRWSRRRRRDHWSRYGRLGHLFVVVAIDIVALNYLLALYVFLLRESAVSRHLGAYMHIFLVHREVWLGNDDGQIGFSKFFLVVNDVASFLQLVVLGWTAPIPLLSEIIIGKEPCIVFRCSVLADSSRAFQIDLTDRSL
jgi:hypothetical protein